MGVLECSRAVMNLASTEAWLDTPSGNLHRSGLTFPFSDLGNVTRAPAYPLLSTRFYRGIAGLFDRVARDHDFGSAVDYLSEGHPCLDLRKYLIVQAGVKSPGLHREEFYRNV